MQLSIVIPEYNEIENLKSGVLDEVKKFLIDSKLDAEVIISDDGSDDGSLEFSENYSKSDSRFSVLTNKHGGKASALLKGIEKSKGEWVLITDMDQSTPIFEVLKLLQYSSDYEIIIGSRGAVRSNTSVLRKLASYIFSTFRKSLVLSDIEDTQCGFKLLDSVVAKQIFPMLEATHEEHVRGWRVSAFDVELLYIARKKGYKIKEVKVEWENKDKSETKKRKFVRESLDMIKEVIRVRMNGIKGKYTT